MRIGTIALLVTVCVASTRPALCQGQPSGPVSAALGFFEKVASTDIDSTLRGLRKIPLSSEERDLTRAMLDRKKPLVPTAAELKKLDALNAVLIYHERDHIFDINVVDAPQAFIGLRARVILVVSRPALKRLTASELQALAAHELGHEFLWANSDEIPPGRARQELELKCDGIAALTLLALGMDPQLLIDAVKKLERFNQRFGVTPNAGDYPTLHDREQLVTALINRLGGKVDDVVSMNQFTKQFGTPSHVADYSTSSDRQRSSKTVLAGVAPFDSQQSQSTINHQIQSAISNLNRQSTIKSISNQQSSINNLSIHLTGHCHATVFASSPAMIVSPNRFSSVIDRHSGSDCSASISAGA